MRNLCARRAAGGRKKPLVKGLSSDTPSGCLALFGVNEKDAMYYATTHAVWSKLRPIDSSHLHWHSVASGPPAFANASGTEICAKAETAEVRVDVNQRKISTKKSRKIISKFTAN